MNGLNYPPAPPPPFLSKEEEDLLKRTILKGYPEDDQESFIRICQRTRLDPFTKQIYATRRWQKVREGDGQFRKVPTLVPVTGIMGLCAVADRTGNYLGCEIRWTAIDGIWREEWLEEEPPAAARCRVFHRQRPDHPEIYIARWKAFAGQQWDSDKREWVLTDFWDKMDDYMLSKCAKAGALRAAFPDPLGGVYIREELESNISDTDTETVGLSPDEQVVAQAQQAEADVLARMMDRGKISGEPAGVKIVETKPGTKRPTPAEALEPAFPEDKIPAKPKTPSAAVAPKKVPPPPQSTPVAAAPPAASSTESPAEPPDDNLDMGAEPEPPQEGSAPPGDRPQESATPWKDHLITGIDHVRFRGRKIGDLNAQELATIENQWLPAVREQWEDATDAQRNDATAFEAAIAFMKMQKPW